MDAAGLAREKASYYAETLAAAQSFFRKYDVDIVGKMATVASLLKMKFAAMWFVGFYNLKSGQRAAPAAAESRGRRCACTDVAVAFAGGRCASVPQRRGGCGRCATSVRWCVVCLCQTVRRCRSARTRATCWRAAR
jgi:hypothetical protein